MTTEHTAENDVPVAIRAQSPDLETAWRTIAWWEQTCAYWQAEAQKGYALRDNVIPPKGRSMPEQSAETGALMMRGRTDAETAMLNGWDVGTLVRGHEQWADGVGVWSTWRITAIGEECVLVKTIRRDYTGEGSDREPDLRVGPEHTATFRHRDWTRVAPSG